MTQNTKIDPLDLAARLIRCPSVTPSDAGALDLLESALDNMGFTCWRLPFSEKGTATIDNLFARFGEGSPAFCYAGHTDVVPVGDLEAWQRDPFSGLIEDGILHGRGAADMKGGIASFVAAVSNFLDKKDKDWPGSISFIITGDEEGPSINGTRKILDWMVKEGLQIDVCLVGEPTSQKQIGDMVKIGRRGSLNGKLEVHGIQGHTAYPQLADNPIPRLVSMLRVLTEKKLDLGNEHFQESTIAISSVDVGNTTTNLIPASARAAFNIRFNNNHSSDSISSWLREEFDKIDTNYTLDISVSGESFLTRPGNFTGLVTDSVARVLGTNPILSTGGGTSDARFIKDHAEVAELGLVGLTIHKTNEQIAVADLYNLQRIYLSILEEYFAEC